MVNSIDDAVGTDNNFTNHAVVKLWHNPAKLWKLSELFGVRDKKPAKFKRPIRRIN